MTDPRRSLEGKIIVVTGASRGIGYQVALEAGRRGAHVLCVARTVGGLEELDDAIRKAGGEATLVPHDLLDYEGIDRMGQAIFDRWGRLDGLVGNAGYLATLSPLSHLDPKDFERSMALNVTANYRLIRSFDLLLRQSAAGRAVFVTSSSAQSAKPFWGAYAASKAALEAMVKSYAAEVATTPIKVNLVQPGPVRTAMRAKAMPGEDPATLTTPAEVAPLIVDLVEPGVSATRSIYDYPSRALTAL